jgi:hypothetical protein
MAFEVDTYQAQLTFQGEKSRDNTFEARADPTGALEQAKQWVESETRRYLAKHRVQENRWEAGSILAVSADDGPAGTPTATLFVENGKTLDWDD